MYGFTSMQAVHSQLRFNLFLISLWSVSLCVCVSLSHTQFKLIQAWVFQIIVLYQVSLFLVSQPVQFWCFTAPTTSRYYFLPVCSHIFSLSIVVKKKKKKKSYTHTKEISLISHQENKHHLTLRIVLLLYRYKINALNHTAIQHPLLHSAQIPNWT